MVDLRLLNSSGAFRRDLECHWAGPVRGREACPERGARCATVVHVGPVAHAWLKKATVPGRSSVLRGADCWGAEGRLRLLAMEGPCRRPEGEAPQWPLRVERRTGCWKEKRRDGC